MKKNDPIGLEPKRENRFIVEFVGTEIEAYSLCKTQRPVYNLEGGWEDMTFELLDLIGPSTSKQVYDGIIAKSKKDCDVIIKMLDPTGVEVEKWFIIGDYTSVDFGVLDYSSDALSKIKITLKVKKCMLS